MKTPLNHGDFARVVRHIGERFHELRGIGDAGTDPGRGGVADVALEELGTSLEELTLAEEELRRQSLELAQANVSIEAERRRYQEMFWLAPHAYVTTDARGTIHEANRAAGDLLRAAPINLQGKPLGLLVELEERPAFERWLRELRDGGDPPRSRELRCQTIDRAYQFPAALEVSRVSGRRERRDELRWSIVDLAERDAAREAGRLRDEARRKDEFVATLGHELRNPLSAIAMIADVLAGELTTDRSRWALGILRRHGDQLRRLIDDLLDISRVSHGKVALQRARIDLGEVLAHGAEAIGPTFSRRSQELVVERPPRPIEVDGDPLRLRQVISNLLDNAAKYSPVGSRIEIALRADGDRGVVVVRDHGIGISPDRLQQIFAMFEQGADAPRPSSEAGLGVGLALARQLVELHGGTIEARSEGLGRGSELEIRLPLAHPAPEAPPAPPPPEPTPPAAAAEDHRPLRLILADDNEDAAEVLALSLERLGHAVRVVHDGGDAIAEAEAETFDVAVLDLGMPTIDGFSAARRLRELTPDIFLVALTGFGDAANRARARDAGFDHYLVKPVTVVELDRMLRRRVQLRLLS